MISIKHTNKIYHKKQTTWCWRADLKIVIHANQLINTSAVGQTRLLRRLPAMKFPPYYGVKQPLSSIIKTNQ